MYNFLKMAMPKGTNSGIKPCRLGPVEGYSGKNEVICHLPNSDIRGYVIFFGGDIQDFKENMMKHRDNQHHVEWDLESTCVRLHRHFPESAIFIIKPAKMSLMTFSCYENFVEVNNFGAPTYKNSLDSLKHLKTLIFNIEKKLNIQPKDSHLDQNNFIILVGFSKGCVVLNQFLYSFPVVNKSAELQLFVNRITDIFWLEGGHSGATETWVSNKSVLTHFASMNIVVHIHVTPYQILCDTRPRIGKEEKVFHETLLQMGCSISRILHFADEPRSLENHFRVLDVFKALL